MKKMQGREIVQMLCFQFGWLYESLQGYWRKPPEIAGRGGGQAGYGRHQSSGL